MMKKDMNLKRARSLWKDLEVRKERRKKCYNYIMISKTTTTKIQISVIA